MIHGNGRGQAAIGGALMLAGCAFSAGALGGCTAPPRSEQGSTDTVLVIESGNPVAVSPAEFFPVRSAREVCPDAGYLCAGSSSEELQLHRWPETVTYLTVRVPLPELDDRAHAIAIRDAAVRGLLAWDGQPLRLRILAREVGGNEGADMTVEWVPTLPDRQIGRVRTVWAHRDREIVFGVAEFQIALGTPEPVRRLEPIEIQRVAAHEMGHALGLGHSDSPQDLMFPQNVAEHLSARDYRTLSALYRLPNGTRISLPE